ncbi:wall-associated receptor kinase 17-like [Cryptomeria japonica]|uniref:wall-associated receptor kinase 17-like n=1 Tax=Cryptomeria japonica TaxID=3369 RepID=UPI0027DA5EC2|nr:wall-associated receptor kinase 17-like [Cryptomeria japonica]
MLMHCGVLVRFVICLCLASFTAGKCNPEMCGSINVSYPFWINNDACGYPGFQITCGDKDIGIPWLAPFLYGASSGNNSEPYDAILEIDYTGYLVINSFNIYAESCEANSSGASYYDLPSDGPFTISNSNRFIVVGCDTFGNYSFGGLGEVGCVSKCDSQNDRPYCRYGCCEINLPNNQQSINFTGGGRLLMVSALTGGSAFRIVPWLNQLQIILALPKQNALTPLPEKDMYADVFLDMKDMVTSKAQIVQAFNPSDDDCSDINECSDRKLNMCVGAEGGGICLNSVGSYNCSCVKGYEGDGFRNGTRCIYTSSNRAVFPAIIGSVSSFVVVCLAGSIVVWWLKKRHLKVVEAKYFQQLQQHIASRVGRESLRMFSAKELTRTSNNYSKEMVLGSGGFGTVFKGILLDGTLVAIKKSKQALNLEDDHEFLNEVSILSQINHRNIVKLLGCCIHTKFPLLVSEFVTNGTLFEHLHSKESYLAWASRLQIAIETAEASAYLHSGASQPIFHRDVKSCNILLNERLSPKLADFGISRLISASNDTYLTTNIMSTRGYLDPEYFQTYQLTEKSDEYSFGVVLVELLTSLKPISTERASEEWNLSYLFLSRLNDNRRTEILDSKVLKEENLQQMEDMGRLARECLHLERRKRPLMKEVVEELFWIRGGTRKTKFHDSVNCDDAIFEQTTISRKTPQNSYEFRSYTFPSTAGSTSEEPSTALIEMSTLP